MPSWYGALLLASAAYRCWLLVAVDDIGELVRSRIYRGRVMNWLECPWCSGAWLALGWWLGYQLSPHWSLVAAVPFALSLGVGLLARL